MSVQPRKRSRLLIDKDTVTDWSMLTLELLCVIAMKLETLEDFIYFSTVCRSWNHVSSIIKDKWTPTPVPWLLLAENSVENPDRGRNIFAPSNGRCYRFDIPETFGTRCWGSAYGWVAIVDRDLRVRLFNPITKSKILFPSLETFPGLWEHDRRKRKGRDNYIHWVLSVFIDNLFVLKVSRSGHQEFIIMILHGYQSLAFARHGDQSWTPVSNKYSPPSIIVDVVCINNDVFALYADGAIEYWNVRLFQSLELVKPMDYSPPGESRIYEELMKGMYKVYLVHSGTDLLAVLRYKEEVDDDDDDDDDDDVYRTTCFEVYRIDPKKQSWERIEDLGDMALFIGVNTSMCLSVEKTGLQRNCIYFTDDETVFWELVKDGGHDIGVYDIKSKQKSSFYVGGDTESLLCPPTWFISQF